MWLHKILEIEHVSHILSKGMESVLICLMP